MVAQERLADPFLRRAGSRPLKESQLLARSRFDEFNHVPVMPKLTESRFEENFPGASLTEEEIEFAFAMETYMRKFGRRFPTWHEVLRVAHSLGYRKPIVRRTLAREDSE